MTSNTTEIKKTDVKEIDYLDEDPVCKEDQKWICVSFLSPEGIMNCKMRGFKFRGAFSTYEEAQKHADKINKSIDPNFHIFVGEGFKWLPWDPDPYDEKSVQNQEYREKELNKLMKAYKKNLEKKATVEAERKQDLIKKAQMEQQKPVTQTEQRLKKKLEKRKQNANTETTQNNENQVDKKNNNKKNNKRRNNKNTKVSQKEEIVNDNTKIKEEILKDKTIYETATNTVINDEKKLNNAKKEVDEIGKNLDKLQELYKQMTNQPKK